jgi:pimeloyl-ACP methyl ester carboxylesterase
MHNNDDVRPSAQPQESAGWNAMRLSRRRMLKGSGAALAALGLIGTTGFDNSPSVQANERGHNMSENTAATKPIIILVHGAWADGSSWSNVISRLQEDDYTVVAPAVSLSSLSADIAATRKVISDLGAPALVVGHSYGGAVITGAATGLSNVKGLVYVAAFAPNTGESLLGLTTQFGEKYGPTPLGQYFRPDGPFDADHPQTLIYLDRANFGSVFVQDIDPERAAVLAATQRPPAVASFGEPLQGTPAWKQFRAWYQVSANDLVIGPAGERFFANRMNAETIELESSHASPVSHPRAIATLIEQAANAVR